MNPLVVNLFLWCANTYTSCPKLCRNNFQHKNKV